MGSAREAVGGSSRHDRGRQAKPEREAPPSIRRGQRDQGNVMDVISHSTADAQARSFVDNWATAEPLSR